MSSNIVAARREARKRKILENAENRLTRISNNDMLNTKYENNLHSEENGMSILSEEPSCSIVSNGGIHSHTARGFDNRQSHNNVLHNELNYTFIESINRLVHDIQNNESTAEENYTATPSTKPSSLAQHMCTVGLAILVRFLFVFNLGHLIANSIIVPYILMAVSRFVLIKTQPSPLAGLLQTVLILSGISPQKISFLLKFFVIINEISLEFCLYLFTFISVHVLIGSSRTS